MNPNKENPDPNKEQYRDSLESSKPDPEPVIEEPHPEPQKEKKDFHTFYEYAQNNLRDIIAYVLLVLGIILLFFVPIVGGLLIGLISGLYFSKEIITLMKELEDLVETQGLGRSIVLGTVILALFISAPAIFVGAAIMVAIRLFVTEDKA